MSDLSNWTNTSPFHRKRNAAIQSFTRKADAAKAARDAALERAKDYNEEKRLAIQREAAEAYNREIDAATYAARADFRAISEGIREGFKTAAAVAPSAGQVNFLTAFKLRDTATTSDVEAAYSAVSALGGIIGGVKLEGFDTPLSAPFPTYSADSAVTEAERHLERKLSHLAQYAAGGFYFVDLDAYDGTWTPLCHYLELCGIR